jgi:transcription elongation GreA/GreB family factor
MPQPSRPRTAQRSPQSRAICATGARGAPAPRSSRPPDAPSAAAFGTTLTIERDDDRRQTWRIVGEDEADPSHGTLSYVSPVRGAPIGKRVGDVARAGNSDAEIVAIE